LSASPLGHGQGQVHEAILVRLNLYAVQGEEDEGCGSARAFVAVDERVVLRNVYR
jgi:hypothetical protein